MPPIGLIDPDRAASLLDARDMGVFSDRLLELAHSATGIEELFAYRIGDGAPETLASSSELADADERSDAFARRFHLSDPASIMRQELEPGSGFVCRIPSSAIELGPYRKLCFDHPGFYEKICFGWRSTDSTLVLTFYQRHSDTEPDMAQLGALAQIAITGMRRLIRHRLSEADPVATIETRLAERFPILTTRESQVCARSLSGLSATGIGKELGIGDTTVLTYRQRAYQKLGISKSNDLLAAIMD